MKKLLVIRVISLIMLVIGIAMVSAIPVAWIMNDSREVILDLTYSSILTCVISLVIYFLVSRQKERHETIRFREGFAVVTLGWVAASAVAAVPFMVVADLTFFDGFFECMSGFTTTGASILDASHNAAIESLPKGLLYWRAMTHWLGGMGIVVLSLAILPVLGVGGMQLFKAEVPGPISDQLTPRIADSAKILWGVYVLLTGIETVLLRIAGMPWFDSVCHSFATLATGGFSTKNSSIEFYHNAAGFGGGVWVDVIITLFMFLAGCNFILHLNALRGKPFNYFKDEEFRYYFYFVFVTIVLSTLFLCMAETYPGKGLGYIIQNTAFTTVSIITTTGFCTGNFDMWPEFCRLTLLGLMFVGGCGGSTGGGMKVSRVIILFRYAKAQVSRCFSPHMVTNVQFNANRLTSTVNHRVLSFFALFVGLFAFTAIALTILEPTIDLESACATSIACLGNIGPGLGKVGAWENYAWFSDSSKMLLSFAMLAGRLEIYTVMVLLLPKFWKK